MLAGSGAGALLRCVELLAAPPRQLERRVQLARHALERGLALPRALGPCGQLGAQPRHLRRERRGLVRRRSLGGARGHEPRRRGGCRLCPRALELGA